MARDDRPDIEWIDLGDRPPAPPAPPPPAVGERPNGPDRTAAAGAERRRRSTDPLRWGAALLALVMAVTVLVLVDRRGDPGFDGAIAVPTTTTEAPRTRVQNGSVTVPAGLSGTLYVLAGDGTLVEIDLERGDTRSARLDFAVGPWFVNQVVPLEQVVLVVTRRGVWSVDRATLLDQEPVAGDRWVLGDADGRWAALLPPGAQGGPVELVDGAGDPLGVAGFTLPAGADARGVIDDALAVDAAGVATVVPLPDGPGVAVGGGRLLATGGPTVARLVCEGALDCTLHSGPVSAPDTHIVTPPQLAAPWLLGPGGVLSPAGDRLVVVSRGGAGLVPRAVDLTTGLTVDSPTPLGRAGVLPPVAFDASGSAVLHVSPAGVAVWTPGAGAPELELDGEAYAVGVAPTPPPRLPSPAGPPPSYA